MNSTTQAVKTPPENQKVDSKPSSAAHTSIDGPYAKYVLMVLVLVYVLNFLDRQIFSILAQDIKADLNLTDADLGFLAGTAFVAFFSLIGIPLARLADVWNRKKLISIGLGVWSLMTVLSGTARSFIPMAFCRFGIAVGEASASPAAYSILYDYFSPKVRSTVLAIYGSGAAIGAGLGLFLGGSILAAWNSAFPDLQAAPFGLRGWQVAFFVVGLPGLLMTFWVSTLREPVRGQGDNIVGQAHQKPFREALMVLMSMLPIGSLWVLKKEGAEHYVVSINVVAAILIFIVCYGLAYFTGDLLQWITVGIGIYAVISWVQVLAIRDPVVFGLILKCKTILYISFGVGLTQILGLSLVFWAIPFIQRYYGVSSADVGLVLGAGNALMGFVGIILGGILADKLRVRSGKGKLYVLLFSIAGSVIFAFLFLMATDLIVAYTAMWLIYLIGAMAYGPAVSTVNDLVLPRARATASAFYFLITSFIGGALGPYLIGYISDILMVGGANEAESLRQSLLWSLLMPLVGMVLIIIALKNIEVDEASLLTRSRTLGEDV